ncbi:ABC transporter permease [Cellulomonas terrae]|uniref:ABC transporter permease n=1 Tax=Cellulomonas terrae TaxID=311234 RepID=A0A511JJ71_9CELL|nr:ABC transporter permease [Cellulomonas terrae]
MSSQPPVPLPDAAVPPPGQTGVAEPTPEPDGGRRILHEMLTSSWLVSLLAIVLALILGGLLIAAADAEVQATASYFFSRPSDLISAAWTAVSEAYAALFAGAIFDPRAETFARAIRPLTETLTVATPLILAGLGLGIGFRAGLFNIGAQGQIILGGIFAGYIGFTFDLPFPLHLLLCVIGAALGGALWAGIAGVLKARTGAHEVIVTIMLNNIAIYLVAYLLSLDSFQRPGSNNPVSPPIPESASYPLLLGEGYRLHAGFLVAIAAAVFTWWLMERSTIGFRFRAVGSNPHAARTAGISVNSTYVWVMLTAGAFAGLAGSAQVLGTEHVLTAGVAASYGFDAITVALLGRSKPLGTVLAGILFGALRAGGVVMQARTGTPIDIVLVVQSLIVLFIAAPPLVRSVFRLPSPDTPRAPKPVVPVAAKEVSA